jgi:hypothetical protein
VDPSTLEDIAQQKLTVADGGWPGWELPASVAADGSIWLRDYSADRVLRITPS